MASAERTVTIGPGPEVAVGAFHFSCVCLQMPPDIKEPFWKDCSVQTVIENTTRLSDGTRRVDRRIVTYLLFGGVPVAIMSETNEFGQFYINVVGTTGLTQEQLPDYHHGLADLKTRINQVRLARQEHYGQSIFPRAA